MSEFEVSSDFKKKRISIAHKIAWAMFGVILLFVFSIGLTFYEVNRIKHFTTNLEERDILAVELADSLSQQVIRASSSLEKYVLYDNEQYKSNFRRIWRDAEDNIKAFDLLVKDWGDNGLTTMWREVSSIINLAKQKQEIILAKIIEDKDEAAKKAMVQDLAPLINDLEDKIGISHQGVEEGSGMLGYLSEKIVAEVLFIEEGLDELTYILFSTIIAGIVFTVLFVWFSKNKIVNPIIQATMVARSIASGKRNIKISVTTNDESAELLGSLDTMQKAILSTENSLKESEDTIQKTFDNLRTRIKSYKYVIEKIAQGDLTESIEIDGDDDLSQLGMHLNEMRESLSSSNLKILEYTNTVSSSASQLESMANSLAASSSQQSSAVSESTSVIEEIKATSSQTLKKAGDLGSLAERTHEEGEKGLVAINSTVDGIKQLELTMQSIADTILTLSNKTQQIESITNTVSNLSKQSKLLALNASIEAAKAGEAGKGFAVVANEVKHLAEQSQQATENVQNILQDINQAAQRAVVAAEEGSDGVKKNLDQVETTGIVIAKLADVIRQSSMSSQQISSAIHQEFAGIEQMLGSMSEIEKSTRHFVTATEQTRQSISGLNKVSDSLKKIVDSYKL